MEELGYEAKPPCMDYCVARSLGMTAVPEGFKWAGKKQQDRRLLDRLVKKSKKSKGKQRANPPAVEREASTENREEEEIVEEIVEEDGEGSAPEGAEQVRPVLISLAGLG